MGMSVHQRRVAMHMAVRLPGRDPGSVLILVVLIMVMPVFMLHRLMRMVMLVPLGQMQ
jgi:hypothetical protein